MKNKKGDWTFAHIVGFIIVMAVIIWAVIFYTDLGDKMLSIFDIWAFR